MLQDAYIQAERAKTFLLDNYDLVYATMGVVLVLLLIGFTLHRAKKIPGEETVTNKGEYVLAKRQRRLRQNEKVSDGISDLLLALHAHGELTSEDYERWNLRFAKRLGLRDLLPRKLTSVEMKVAMKKRLGKHVTPKLPKEVIKKQNALELLLSKHVS